MKVYRVAASRETMDDAYEIVASSVAEAVDRAWSLRVPYSGGRAFPTYAVQLGDGVIEEVPADFTQSCDPE